MDENYRQFPSAERNGDPWDCSQPPQNAMNSQNFQQIQLMLFPWISIFPDGNPWHHNHWLIISCVTSLEHIYQHHLQIPPPIYPRNINKWTVSPIVFDSENLRVILRVSSTAVLELQELKQVPLESTSPPVWEMCASNISAMDRLLQPLCHSIPSYFLFYD